MPRLNRCYAAGRPIFAIPTLASVRRFQQGLLFNLPATDARSAALDTVILPCRAPLGIVAELHVGRQCRIPVSLEPPRTPSCLAEQLRFLDGIG